MLKRGSPISKVNLIVVAAVFAVIGGYLLIHSFASGTPVASLEAEQLLLPAGGSVVADSSASGGKAVDLSANGTATGSVSFTSAVSSLTMMAKANVCQGAPQMIVKLDGNTLMTVNVSGSSWTAYSAAANYTAGTHSLSVDFPNDYSKPHGSKACSRDLFLDVANFYGSNVTPPPAPTVSLSASPTAVSAGQVATLSWSSTNATTCSASGAWSGSKTTSGSASTGALSQTSTYTLTCDNTSGSGHASATVTVGAPTVPPAPAIYFNPPTQGFSVGSDITIEVRENSGTTPVNAVQANFSYPADKLTFVSADAGASGFTTQAQNSGGNGTVNLARGLVGSLTGDQLVAKVTFHVAAAGTASTAFTTGTGLVSAADNKNIISSLSANGIGVYTLQ